MKNLFLSEEFVYVHENGLISTKKQFLEDFVSKCYVASVLKEKEPMRQYNSTVFTISSGHLQLKSESPQPQETVTPVWAEQKVKWKLVHRHESHRFEPIGKQLSQRGGPNPTMNSGAKPSPELYGGAASTGWSLDYYLAMLKRGVPNIEAHLYGRGRHRGGLADRDGIPFGTWQDRFIDWFLDLGYLGKPGVPTKAASDIKSYVAKQSLRDSRK